MNNRNEIQIRLAIIRNISNSNILINNFVFKEQLPEWNIIPSRTNYDQSVLKLGPWGKLNLIQLSPTKEVLRIDENQESLNVLKTIGYSSYSIINTTTEIQNQLNFNNLIYNTYFTGVKLYDQNLNEKNISLSIFTNKVPYNFQYQSGDLLLVIEIDKDLGYNDKINFKYYRQNTQIVPSNYYDYYYYITNESNSIITDFCFYNNNNNFATFQIYNPDSSVFNNNQGSFGFYNEFRF